MKLIILTNYTAWTILYIKIYFLLPAPPHRPTSKSIHSSPLIRGKLDGHACTYIWIKWYLSVKDIKYLKYRCRSTLSNNSPSPTTTWRIWNCWGRAATGGCSSPKTRKQDRKWLSSRSTWRKSTNSTYSPPWNGRWPSWNRSSPPTLWSS